MLDETFAPRYPIELAKAGEYFGSTAFSTGVRSARPSGRFGNRRPQSIFGKPAAKPKPYVLFCPMCQNETGSRALHAELDAHVYWNTQDLRLK